MVEGKPEQMLVFFSDLGSRVLAEAEVIAVDGTFKTCPHPFYQLFVVQVRICAN